MENVELVGSNVYVMVMRPDLYSAIQGLRFPEAKVGRLLIRDVPIDGWTGDFAGFRMEH